MKRYIFILIFLMTMLAFIMPVPSVYAKNLNNLKQVTAETFQLQAEKNVTREEPKYNWKLKGEYPKPVNLTNYIKKPNKQSHIKNNLTGNIDRGNYYKKPGHNTSPAKLRAAKAAQQRKGKQVLCNNINQVYSRTIRSYKRTLIPRRVNGGPSQKKSFKVDTFRVDGFKIKKFGSCPGEVCTTIEYNY